MPDELVTIAKFPSLGEAKLAQGKLRSAGISASVRDENMMNMHIGMALSGVRLQVPDSQVVRALEVLHDFSPEGPDTDEDAEVAPCCPECESLEIREVVADGPRQIALWSAAIPFPEMHQGELLRRFKCLACGYQWEEGSEKPGTAAE